MASHAAAIEVVLQLREAGVGDVVILKGVATGHLDYGRPIERFSTDVDLLVRIADRPDILHNFPDVSIPEPRRHRWEARYGKAITVVSDTGVTRRAYDTRWATLGWRSTVTNCSTRPSSSPSGGRTFVRLTAPNRLLHAALHLATSEHVGLHSRVISRNSYSPAGPTGVRW